MNIQILALDQLWDTGLTVVLDALSLANDFAAQQLQWEARFNVSVVGVRKRVRSGHGHAIAVQPIDPAHRPDWVIVPALKATTPETLIPALDRPDVRDAKRQLVQWHGGGTRIAAACIGTFIVADAGLLDHQQATTTWWLGPLFRQRYPQVQLDESRMLIPSGTGVTAGAAMGHLDLALWLIRQASPNIATLVSRYLLADLRSVQARYIIPNHLAQADPLVQRFEQWARQHLQSGFSLEAAARALATSERTLQRRCTAVLGKSPMAYFQDLRIERAQALLHGSSLDVEAIASEVGYDNGATLRALLRERLGRGVRELRGDLL